VGRFEGILAAPSEADIAKAWAEANEWLLASKAVSEA
jgi:hypothetical protein